MFRRATLLSSLVAVFALIVGQLIAPLPYATAGTSSSPGGVLRTAQGRLIDDTLASNTWRSIQVTGVGSLPQTGVSAVAVNLTAYQPAKAGYIQAKASGAAATGTSFLKFNAAASDSNFAVLQVGQDGRIDVLATSTLRLLIDVQGYYTSGTVGAGGFVPVSPKRVADTRLSTSSPTGRVVAGTGKSFNVSSASVPTGAMAAAVSLAIVSPSKAGNVRAQPEAGSSTPWYAYNSTSVSSVGTIVNLSSDGSFKLYISDGTADVVVDVVGYFTADSSGGSFHAANGRVFDSRTTASLTVGPEETRTFQATGTAGIPTGGVSALQVNVTAVGGVKGGYLNLFSDAIEPLSSVLQYYSGATNSNAATASVDANGRMKVANHGNAPVTVIVDAAGWYESAPIAGTPAPPTGLAMTPGGEGFTTSIQPTLSAVLPQAGLKARFKLLDQWGMSVWEGTSDPTTTTIASVNLPIELDPVGTYQLTAWSEKDGIASATSTTTAIQVEALSATSPAGSCVAECELLDVSLDRVPLSSNTQTIIDVSGRLGNLEDYTDILFSARLSNEQGTGTLRMSNPEYLPALKPTWTGSSKTAPALFTFEVGIDDDGRVRLSYSSTAPSSSAFLDLTAIGKRSWLGTPEGIEEQAGEPDEFAPDIVNYVNSASQPSITAMPREFTAQELQATEETQQRATATSARRVHVDLDQSPSNRRSAAPLRRDPTQKRRTRDPQDPSTASHLRRNGLELT